MARHLDTEGPTHQGAIGAPNNTKMGEDL